MTHELMTHENKSSAVSTIDTIQGNCDTSSVWKIEMRGRDRENPKSPQGTLIADMTTDEMDLGP